MTEPRTIRWGILATGGIALTSTRDLLTDPTTRGVTNLRHTVVAAASSSSQSKAESFLRTVNAPPSAKPYGSYADLIADPSVDIVYIATPHSHHYTNALLALRGGKHVLCEKALTVNAAQARHLVETARERGVLLMEAVWTRYFPLTAYVREVIQSGRLGPVTRVLADCSVATEPHTSFPDGAHRMVNPALAGGALLDMGIYSLTWVFTALWRAGTGQTPPRVVSAMAHYGPTGADEMCTVVVVFPRAQDAGGDAHGIATTSMRVDTDPGGRGSAPSVRIQGPKGEVQVFPPTYRPTKTRVVLLDGTVEEKDWAQPGPGIGSKWFNGFGGPTNAEGEGHGMFWEADEAARCVIEGRKEGALEGWDESVLIMEVMDEVRKQGGLVYPEEIERVE
ncbi:oxidoreductase domain-containing protein [Trichodelitschia bisporula]|uniref:D-xylose 1-dehydrogenase (NADP(+), D-xylono-1,5-lactone-forming) n=1 Tax=Trichodelitschia bisporula TaxID=703511 RepID=A0A6G1HS22_9PEZI|nr:oxidoreductase domain-containing protein [Trichodelitschia bisporula]